MIWYSKHKNTVPLENRISFKWTRGEGLSNFETIKPKIPIEFHDLERMGTFNTGATIESAPYCLSVPLREDITYGHFLEDETEVAIFSKGGDMVYRGRWKDTTVQVFEPDPELYIYVITLPLIPVIPG